VRQYATFQPHPEVQVIELPRRERHQQPHAGGDRRDLNAIERLSAALLTLYFPDLRVTREEFEELCLQPAIALRQRIREQLAEVDPGSFAGKPIARAVVRPETF
jgi:predicted ATP-dependent Lon-type protease